MDAESVSIPVYKWGANVPLSVELIPENWPEFPRRSHQVTIPLTPEEQSEYADLKRRWKKAEKAWEKVTREAEKRDWGRTLGGYDYEAAELYPLEPRTETVYDETVYEWQSRVAANRAHHAATGKLLEEPQPRNFMEMIALNLARKLDHSPILGLISATEGHTQ